MFQSYMPIEGGPFRSLVAIVIVLEGYDGNKKCRQELAISKENVRVLNSRDCTNPRVWVVMSKSLYHATWIWWWQCRKCWVRCCNNPCVLQKVERQAHKIWGYHWLWGSVLEFSSLEYAGFFHVAVENKLCVLCLPLFRKKLNLYSPVWILE